jgi:ABC-type sugar transport system ATPase subunit
MAGVELRGVTKVFSGGNREPVRALDNLSLQITDGELVAIVGPSGSGKTTLLRVIAGLETLPEGEIVFDGKRANDLGPQERNVAMVFQDSALLPHLNVRENVALGMKLRRASNSELEHEIGNVCELVGIKKLLPRLPQELSGGERQRVALARAIVRRPRVFLFDEPFSSLDAPMRWQLRTLIARLHRELRATMLYVTHDQVEAMALGDRVAVLREGAVQQSAEPLALYRCPANAFVASFIGSPPMNLFRGNITRRGEGFIFLEHNVSGAANGTRLEAALDPERATRLASFADGNALLGIRSEHIVIASDGDPHARAIVELVEHRGPEMLLRCSTGASSFCVRVPAERTFQAGEMVPVRLDLRQAVFFNPVSEKVIA